MTLDDESVMMVASLHPLRIAFLQFKFWVFIFSLSVHFVDGRAHNCTSQFNMQRLHPNRWKALQISSSNISVWRNFRIHNLSVTRNNYIVLYATVSIIWADQPMNTCFRQRLQGWKTTCGPLQNTVSMSSANHPNSLTMSSKIAAVGSTSSRLP